MFNGQELRLSEIARITGHRHSTILNRFDKGDRGPNLWRPLDKSGPHRIDPTDTEHRQMLRDRREERERAIARARAEHAAAIARPLIDANLLTPAERREIRSRIKFARNCLETEVLQEFR